MKKKALCVGINKYPLLNGKDITLKGCVNDALAWADLLINHYDFLKDDVKFLLDEQATKANMIEGLKNLFIGAQAGDVLVFTNASHGTYVIDKDDDEPSKEWIGQYDQAICPYDCKDNLLIDDEIREFLSEIPTGVRAIVISDSCHSATVTRTVAEILSIRSQDNNGHDKRHRLLPPSWMGRKELDLSRSIPNVDSIAKKAKESKYSESKMKEILLSGCKRMQSSFDDIMPNGKYHGAMTHYTIQAIKDADYKLTYQELHDRYLKDFDDKYGYNQQPQLEGTDANKQRPLFT